MSIIEPTDLTLKYSPWSVSKADCASLCPRKFNKTYINKPKEKAPEKTDALIGKAVHKILEYALDGQSIDRAFKFALGEFSLTWEEKEEIAFFKPNVIEFLQRFAIYRKKVSGYKPTLEEKLGVTVDWKPTQFFAKNVFMRGVIDLSMDIIGKPHTIIIDHKTGKVRDLSYYEAQFDSYMLLKRATIPNLEKIIVGVNYIRDKEIKIRKKPAVLNDVRDITPIGNRVMHYLNNASSNLLDLSITKKSPLCNWCDHKDGCPLWSVEGSHGSKKEQ